MHFIGLKAYITSALVQPFDQVMEFVIVVDGFMYLENEQSYQVFIWDHLMMIATLFTLTLYFIYWNVSEQMLGTM